MSEVKGLLYYNLAYSILIMAMVLSLYNSKGSVTFLLIISGLHVIMGFLEYFGVIDKLKERFTK